MGAVALPLMIAGTAVSAAGTLVGGAASARAGREAREASIQSGIAAQRRAQSVAASLEQSGDASLTGSVMAADAVMEAGRSADTLAGMTSDALRASGVASEEAGLRAQQSYEFKAAQETIAAGEARATGQRGMFEKQRDTRLLLSRLQARAAASGGSADDPSILALAGQIAQRGEYSALTDMYAGETRALGLEDMAVSDRMTGAAVASEGRQKHIAAWTEANARLFEGRAKHIAAAREAAGRLYEGATRRDASYTQARITRETGDDQFAASVREGNARAAEGEARQTASYFSAASTLLSGTGSAYRSFNNPTERTF
jgi:hypothetical protein